MFKGKSGGFRIYKDDSLNTLSKATSTQTTTTQDPDFQVAMLQRLHEQTKIFGLLVYKGELKGIRFYDFSKRQFIDIAPWQIQYFNVSGMKISGVRELQLFKVDNEQHNQTHVVQYLTQHEVNEYYRPNRMTSNELAKALSYIMNYIEDAEYENILSELR